MTNKTTMRAQAEAKLAQMPEPRAPTAPAEIQKVLHELRVHQIELEMQNEELRMAQAELDASRARYFDLYDLAPVGYVTVGEQGLILEANFAAATMLGLARDALLQQPITRFIPKDDQGLCDLHRKPLFETGAPQICEMRMVKADGTAFWAHLAANAAPDAAGAPVCRIAMTDITARKQAEQERERLVAEREKALAEIKVLGGLLPICMSCKKIRDDQGYWNQIETYIRSHSQAEFSHSLCPECAHKLYPEYVPPPNPPAPPP